MNTTHDSRQGRRILIPNTIGNKRGFAPGWPGWEAPNRLDFMPTIEAGWVGTITNVESHGAAPYTRYSILFENGVRANGVCPDQVVFDAE
jgi:hypothetical protein